MNSKRGLAIFAVCIAAILFSALAGSAETNPKEFRNWPAGTSPQEVGKRVAERFVSTVKLKTDAAVYPAVCTWYGALTFAQLTGDKTLAANLAEHFDAQMTPEITALINEHRHVDYSVIGAVPFEIYIQTKQAKYLHAGKIWADRQWENPDSVGLTPETRFWIDDMYMITILQVQAYRASGDQKYIDRAATEMVAYLDKLQTSERPVLSLPGRAIFLGTRQWLGRRRHDRVTAFSPGESSTTRTHPGRLSEDDGVSAEVSRQRRHVASADRPS